MSKKTLIRCGEKNNFNFTAAEIDQLKGFAKKGEIFVNSNSLVNITGDFPAIITINPYLKFAEPCGDLSNVKACRIKWVCSANEYTHNEQRDALLWAVSRNVPVLLTFMRFKSYVSLHKYAHKEAYVSNSGWLRPTKKDRVSALEYVMSTVSDMFGDTTGDLIYTCDMEGHGCPSCNNCIRLIVGDGNVNKYDIKSLNLSSSGDKGRCIFNCPDCWAKSILKIVKNQTPRCDVLFANRKQKGLLAHE